MTRGCYHDESWLVMEVFGGVNRKMRKENGYTFCVLFIFLSFFLFPFSFTLNFFLLIFPLFSFTQFVFHPFLFPP